MTRGERSIGALKLYIERGRCIAKLLEKGELVGIEKKIQGMRAAFYNFRSLDVQSRGEGFLIEGHEGFDGLLEDLKVMEKVLYENLKTSAEVLGQQAFKLRKVRQNLRKYHSGNSLMEGHKFVNQTV